MPRRMHSLLLLALLAVAIFSGCGSRKVVEIPQDYRSPALSRQDAGKGGTIPQVKAPPAVPETSQGAIFSPPPTIREKDLPEGTPPAPPVREEKKGGEKPQRLASMHLVDAAKKALGNGKPDQAIPLLEQAVQVDVYNGDAFLQLSRAWRMKHSRAKSLEFAKKAEILLQDQPAKLKEIYLLQAELYREGGDLKKSQAYLQKAGGIK